MMRLPPSFDLNLLHTLYVLIDLRSVTDAGEHFSISQSAMSHRLAKLREFFDDPLLVQVGDELLPTPKAVSLRPLLQQFVDQVSATLSPDTSFRPATDARAFRLATADLAEMTLLPPLLAHLERHAPQVRIDMTGRAAASTEGLARGEAELALLPSGNRPGVGVHFGAGVLQRTLFDEGWKVLVQHAHPRVGVRLSKKRYLAESHLLISPQGGSMGLVDAFLARSGERRKVHAQITSFASAPFLVAQTELLLTCPSSLAALAERHLPVRALKLPIELPPLGIAMYWHERVHNDPAHMWLRDTIAEMGSPEGA